MKYMFALFAKNSANNRITLKVLGVLNKKLDCNLTNEEMELMIKEFDLDQDGSSKKNFNFQVIELTANVYASSNYIHYFS